MKKLIIGLLLLMTACQSATPTPVVATLCPDGDAFPVAGSPD